MEKHVEIIQCVTRSKVSVGNRTGSERESASLRVFSNVSIITAGTNHQQRNVFSLCVSCSCLIRPTSSVSY